MSSQFSEPKNGRFSLLFASALGAVAWTRGFCACISKFTSERGPSIRQFGRIRWGHTWAQGSFPSNSQVSDLQPAFWPQREVPRRTPPPGLPKGTHEVVHGQVRRRGRRPQTQDPHRSHSQLCACLPTHAWPQLLAAKIYPPAHSTPSCTRGRGSVLIYHNAPGKLVSPRAGAGTKNAAGGLIRKMVPAGVSRVYPALFLD